MVDLEQSNNESSGRPLPLEEKQWVRKVREEGDRAAFEKIFRTYYKRLYSFAYGYVESFPQAEDIVQSIFLKIWERREEWDPGGTVQQYLFTAVRNEALNVLRHQRIRDNAEEEVAHFIGELKNRTHPDEDPELEEFRKLIQEGIDQLPSRRRQIFILSRRSGLTYSEIADLLDISINTVGTQMGRALKFLRDYLSDFLPILLAIDLQRILF